MRFGVVFMFDNCGHTPMLERTPELNELLVDFLRN